MKQWILLVLMLPILAGILPEEDLGETVAAVTEIYDVESGLNEEERSVSGTLRLDGQYDAQGALSRLWKWACGKFSNALREEASFAVKIFALAILCGMAGTLSPEGKLSEYAELAACCAVSLLLAGTVDSVLQQTINTLNRLSDYANAAVPAFFTTVAASGAAVSASVKYAAVCLSMDIFLNLSQRLILPLIQAYFAVGIAASLFENAVLSGVMKITKWCVITAMTLMTTVFCLYISFSGAISGSADAVAVKSAKTVISSVLPVVGGILSDSAATVLAAANLIKSSAGIFCLVAVCVLCGGAFMVLSVKLLVFKASSVLSELACGKRFSELLSNAGTAFGMLLGLVGSYGLMLFLSFASGIRMVNGA